MRDLLAALPFLLAAIACGQPRTDEPAARPEPAAAADAGARAAMAPASAGPPAPVDAAPPPVDAPAPRGLGVTTIAELPAVTEVPALDLKLRPASKQKEAEARIAEADRLRTGADLGGAATAYLAALAIDPGQVEARYQLAATWAASGRAAQGLRLLADLDQPGCAVCRGLLVHARTDPAWADLRSEPVFQAIVSQASVEAQDPAGGAKAFARSVDAGKVVPALRAYLHPRRAIRAGVRRPRGEAELTAWIRRIRGEEEDGFVVDRRKGCDASCCRFAHAPSDTVDSLDRLCFASAPGGVLYITEIGVYSYWGEAGEATGGR